MPKRKKTNESKGGAKEMFAFNFAKTSQILKPKPILHVSSNSKVEAEHCRGILQYTSTNICLDMGGTFADINGDNLIISTMQKEKIAINGRIFSIVFRFDKKEAADE